MISHWFSFLVSLVSIPLALLLVLLAVCNLQPVTLSTFPLPFEITLPLAVLLLGFFALGLIGGGGIAWVHAAPARRAARRDRLRLAVLEKEHEKERTAARLGDPSADSPLSISSLSGTAAEKTASPRQLHLPPI